MRQIIIIIIIIIIFYYYYYCAIIRSVRSKSKMISTFLLMSARTKNGHVDQALVFLFLYKRIHRGYLDNQ